MAYHPFNVRLDFICAQGSLSSKHLPKASSISNLSECLPPRGFCFLLSPALLHRGYSVGPLRWLPLSLPTSNPLRYWQGRHLPNRVSEKWWGGAGFRVSWGRCRWPVTAQKMLNVVWVGATEAHPKPLWYLRYWEPFSHISCRRPAFVESNFSTNVKTHF